MFHTDLLTPYHETTLHGDNYQCPPHDLIDGEEEYEVKAILDSRKYRRTKCQQYLVKWRGYPDSDNQWLNKDDVFAEDAIREFKRRHPTKETHIKTLGEQAKSPTSSPLHMNTYPDNYPGPDVDIRIPVSPYRPDQRALDTVEALNRELAEAHKNFPTPMPGRLSPDSFDLGELDLAPSTTVRTVESSSEGVAEGAAADSTSSG